MKQAFAICNIYRVYRQRVRRQTGRTCYKQKGENYQGRQADGDRQPFQVAGARTGISLLCLHGNRHDNPYKTEIPDPPPSSGHQRYPGWQLLLRRPLC